MAGPPRFLRAWRYLAVSLTVLLVFGLLAGGREPNASMFLPLVVTILSLNGLFGLAWQRPLLRKWVWQALVVLQGLVWVPVLFGLPFYLLQAPASLTQSSIVVAMVALQVLVLHGLFLYAFRSPHLWRRSPPADGATDSTSPIP